MVSVRNIAIKDTIFDVRTYVADEVEHVHSCWRTRTRGALSR